MADVVELLRMTVSASDIKRVAIVDDVFDTPNISPEDMGALLKFLEGNLGKSNFTELGQDLLTKAISDVRNSELDSESIAEVVDVLYERYIYTGNGRFDPTGVFERTSGPNLIYVRPLLELLKSCKSLEIHTFGSAPPTLDELKMPDLIFVDLYLSSNISPVDLPNAVEAGAAIGKSLKQVVPLLKKNPSIVLMSSHGEIGKQESDKYRANLKNGIYASRFGFVDKGQIRKQNGNELAIEEAARDTLLDIFQTFKFGKALTETIARWLESAKEAVEEIGVDVRKLQLKEIAYLVQFRLAAEGQGLEEYLEWFFGEALLDYIIRATDKLHNNNSLENALDLSAVPFIDGGFEPTKNIAEMYHRIRVENIRIRPRKNFRLGDLYLETKFNRVIAVMTPDCDLVLRKNGKRNADHLLLVPGSISDLEKASASVGDFLIIDDTPHNIQWDYKKMFSLPFEGILTVAGQSDKNLRYIGALRPLYAQEIQANLINQIGRVGVAVPPVIGIPAIATIVVRTPSGLSYVDSPGVTFNCSLIPDRTSNDKARVVFDREVIRKIKTAIVNLSSVGLVSSSAENIDAIKKDNGDLLERKLKLGPEIGAKLSNGIMLTDRRDSFDSASWCALSVTRGTAQTNDPAKLAGQTTAAALLAEVVCVAIAVESQPISIAKKASDSV
jgi:hypothetical protein